MSERKNVRSYRRKSLEPEIAAMSVGIEGDEAPAVIVNLDDPKAKSAIRKVIIWIGGAGLVEWLRKTARNRPAVTALAGTVLATTAATSAIAAVIVNRQEPPPAAIQHMVTLPGSPLPAATVTATVSVKPKRLRSAPARPSLRPARSHTAPPASPSVVRPTLRPSEPAPQRTQRQAAPHTRTPTHHDTPPATPRPAAKSTRSASADLGSGGDARPAPSRSTSASSTSTLEVAPQPDEQQPATAARGCGGLIDVKLDPLLDLCLLG